MAEQRARYVRLGGTNAEGFHLAPRSSCCSASVVYRRDGGRYVGVPFDDAMPNGPADDLRCGRCNGPLTGAS